ncbi:hypothetical protein MKD49_05590 [Herbaspirillum sp. WGmk3]|uniref:ComEC/Rec2 family competence protein n=1 Tax=Herbaspirillum sp. WGmk3 TaxID=2919925 RepID=UPI0020906490|nr:hypothetical protein [Herbaspirillum sp. WGmk3]MCO4855955.1 hypothetical protein [Herbaspirillum sp. WGmk3]
MFEVRAIQAEHGDALLVSYGDTEPHHILIDGGPRGTLPNILHVLEGCKSNGRVRLEALVVTHYDLDHIEGVIELLRAKPGWLEISDIWFNGFRHITPADVLGSAEADTLAELIEGKHPWNSQFGGGPIKVGDMHPLIMPGGLKVWVLSPDRDRLSRLAAEWGDGKIVPETSDPMPPRDLLGRKDEWPPSAFADLATAASRSDGSIPNGSSIALLLEFDEQRAILTGDAFASVVGDAIETYWDTAPVVHFLKVSHHGSKANTTDKLLKILQCKRFLISTSGKGPGHPDHVLIARLVASTEQPELIFNYDNERTANWRNPPADWPGFTATFPNPAECFVRIVLK